MADITGRVGFTADRALVYLKGGVAWADSEYTVSLPALGLNTSISDTRIGGLLGVGVEYAVTRNWSAKVEYNYIDFGTETYTANALGIAANAEIDQQMHVVKGGVNYRF